ncbi:MAG: DEAD/DEAH box helicase [Chitinophagaceae bacterium]
MTFADFNLDEQLMEGLDAMNFNTPTPIQQQAIPIILQDKDLVACAQTGTGKTAAYLLPVIHKLMQKEDRKLNTLILAPTRELAQQIDQQVEGIGYFTGVSSMAIYGGGDGALWTQQKKAILEGADIIIATPGRLIGHLASGAINFHHLEHLILDEADRMLDMGFYDDIVRIIQFLPQKRQTLLFSATMPPKIRTLANKILHQPEQINISVSKPAEGILQQAYMVFDEQKTPLISSLLKDTPHQSIIIFASTKETVKKLHTTLKRKGFGIEAFHSDLEQAEREAILQQFKSRRLPILIGTDVLSRGIDVEGIGLVVNYDVPPDPEDYIHRIGRTARAATTGTAITFITPRDQRRFHQVEQLMEREVSKLPVPEELGPVPEYNPGAGRGSGGGRNFGGNRKGGGNNFNRRQPPRHQHNKEQHKGQRSGGGQRGGGNASPKQGE